ncbi:MAG: hypothetical protein CMP11_05005 [Zetaproteobacteria bacterium]|nr:hypothetical protein [Pseudobdellovibrionaceae bacterium]|tara:strand:+ start:559 stop:879 length:321 start_codon:yes stop_codon:yes gene_type:complete
MDFFSFLCKMLSAFSLVSPTTDKLSFIHIFCFFSLNKIFKHQKLAVFRKFVYIYRFFFLYQAKERNRPKSEGSKSGLYPLNSRSFDNPNGCGQILSQEPVEAKFKN